MEPVPIKDDFATGIVVEACGDHVRLLFFAERPCVECEGMKERLVVRRVVLSALDYRLTMRKLLGIQSPCSAECRCVVN